MKDIQEEILNAIEEIKTLSNNNVLLSTDNFEVLLLASLIEEEGQ